MSPPESPWGAGKVIARGFRHSVALSGTPVTMLPVTMLKVPSATFVLSQKRSSASVAR